MHIGLFGVSGSGKTTLANKIRSKENGYIITSASKLISESGGKINITELSKNNINSNQEILIHSYRKLKNEKPNTLIEFHAVIENEEGYEIIPPKTLRSLELDYVFFLKTPPTEILKRRIKDKTKKRKITNTQNIIKVQEASLELVSNAYHNTVKVITEENGESEILKVIRS